MLKLFRQQQDLLSKNTELEEKREKRESDGAKRQLLKDSIGRGVKPPVFRGDKGEKTRSSHPESRRLGGFFQPFNDRCHEGKKL